MSYIVRASWMEDVIDASNLWAACVYATGLMTDGELREYRGTVTITKDGEVIREYKVGEQE